MRPRYIPILLACVFMFGAVCGSQSTAYAPASPPKVLLLVRQQFKTGMGGHHERLERAMSAAYNRLDVPVYWMEMQAFTGTPEALFFGLYDSFEAVEKAGAFLAPFYEAHPDLAQIQAGIDETLASQTTILAERRDPPAAINLAQARWLRMLIVRTNAGDGWPEVENSVVYKVTSGQPGSAFVVFQPMSAFSEPPAVQGAAGTIVEDAVYAIEPPLSHVSRGFAGQDRAFWMKH